LKTLKNETTIAQSFSASSKLSHSLPTHLTKPLTKLANEIVLEILLHLQYKDIQSFVLSGLTRINLSQAQGYWKRSYPLIFPSCGTFQSLMGRKISSRFTVSYFDNVLLPHRQLSRMINGVLELKDLVIKHWFWV
jgi:hypothetical protein